MKVQIKYSIFFLFFIYIFLYAPVIRGIPIPTPLFLLPITYIYLLKNKTSYNIFLKLFRSELILLLLLLIYVTILDLWYGKNVYFTHVFYYIFEVLPTSFIIVTVFCKHYDRESFYKLLINVGTIAATISVLSILITPFNQIVTSLLKEVIKTADYSGRSYGFASGLLFPYPIGQGFIGVLCLEMLSKNKKYIFPFFLILISIITNARIGLLPIILYLSYSVLKFNLKTIAYLFLFVVTFIISNRLGIFAAYQTLIDWNLSMFYEISNSFFGTNLGKYGNNYTYLNFIIDHFLIFPNDTLGWILGEHREVFLDPIKNSDMGYINDLIYGGLILVLFILLFFLRIYTRLMRIGDKESSLVAFLILGTYLLANFKGEFFRPSSGIRVLILVFVYLIYNHAYHNVTNSSLKKQ